MENFKCWLESVISNDINLVRKIRKGKLKSWKSGKSRKFEPSTFGFELEFDFNSAADNDKEEFDEKWILDDLAKLLDEGADGIKNNKSFKYWRESAAITHAFLQYIRAIKVCDYFSIESWEKDHEKPTDSSQLKAWTIERNKTLKKINKFFREIRGWRQEFIEELINGIQVFDKKYNWSDFLGHNIGYYSRNGKHKTYIEEIKRLIESFGLETSDYIGSTGTQGANSYSDWQVGPDGRNIEIASPILKTKDLRTVKPLLDVLAKNYLENATGGTSAHVHIGIPKNFDALSSLAVLSFMDEDKAYLESAKRDKKWSVQKKEFIGRLYNELKRREKVVEFRSQSMFMTNDELMDAILKVRDKFDGVSLWNKNFKTIEFRYLSSEILSNVNNFLQWINYYLLLIDVAKNKSRVAFNVFPSIYDYDYDAPELLKQRGSFSIQRSGNGYKIFLKNNLQIHKKRKTNLKDKKIVRSE